VDEINMLVFPRDDFHWQWECGECEDTRRGYGTQDEAKAGAWEHWHDEHEEN
jgi:hypothetical protein